MSKVICGLCPHHCKLSEGQTGLCRARKNLRGQITPINYGKLTALALDPIEKKPLNRFYPGSNILSVGSFGCNLKCPFCQNYHISMAGENEIRTQSVKPEDLISIALDLKDRKNIGIAYTYNEPLVAYEYVIDCAKLARKKNLKNVVVTNGCFCQDPMKELLPLIDAVNVDLKGYTPEFYKRLGGDLDTVINFIKLAAKFCHVEITTLIIPGENDGEDEMRDLSEFISSVSSDIPLHISRFFPSYRMTDKRPTEVKAVYGLADIAREKLKYVYEGNC
jgi:pyruvate formate lyase activating enzyme